MNYILRNFITWSENFISEANVASYYNFIGHKGLFPSSSQIPIVNMGYWKDVKPHEPQAIERAVNAFFCLISDLAEVTAADRLVLDVGCGYGTYAIHCLRHFHPQQIMGLNLAQVQIKAGQQLIKEAGLDPKITLTKGTATEIPLAAAAVDKILCIEAASHFRTREDFFYEAQRVLRPGGLLVLADYVIPPPTSLDEKLHLHLLRYPLQIPRSNVYDQQGYIIKLKAAGFEIVSTASIYQHVIPLLKNWMLYYAPSTFPGHKFLTTLGLTILYNYPIDYLCIKARKK